MTQPTQTGHEGFPITSNITQAHKNIMLPDTPYLFPDQTPRALQQKSVAQFRIKRRRGDGITFQDKRLDSDPLEIMKFFITHAAKQPQLEISITGHHKERDEDEASTKVYDFYFRVPCHNMIGSKWAYIQSTDSPSIAATIMSYVSTWKPVRALEMRKVIQWDFDKLTTDLTSVVRATGFKNEVDIEFNFSDYRVKVKSSSFWNSNTASCLFCPLFFLWLPIKRFILKHKMKGTLSAMYPSVPQELVMEVYGETIKDAIKTRTKMDECIPTQMINTNMLLQPLTHITR